MPPVACALHNVDFNGSVVSPSQTLSSIGGHKHTTPSGKTKSDLITTIESVSSTSQGTAFEIKYDEPLRVGTRPNRHPWVRNAISANMMYTDALFNGCLITMCPKRNRENAIAQTADVFEESGLVSISSDDCPLRTISSDEIAKIIAKDSSDWTFGWWRDIDASTTSASATGDIVSSTHAQDFDRRGRVTWAIFLSKKYHMKIGVSTGSVVFFDGNCSEQDMEDYIIDIVYTVLNHP